MNILLYIVACYASTVCVRLLGTIIILWRYFWLIKMWSGFPFEEPLSLIQYKVLLEGCSFSKELELPWINGRSALFNWNFLDGSMLILYFWMLASALILCWLQVTWPLTCKKESAPQSKNMVMPTSNISLGLLCHAAC